MFEHLKFTEQYIINVIIKSNIMYEYEILRQKNQIHFGSTKTMNMNNNS